jgi:leucine-zipper of insertion element IS481
VICGPPLRLWVFPDSTPKGLGCTCTLTPSSDWPVGSRSWHRWLDSGRKPQPLLYRSSRPRRSPRQLAPELEGAICACRRATGWGPRLVAGATGFAHSTVWKVLKRAGISRPPRRSGSRPTATSGRVPAICCTWTSAATRVSCAQATASPATAHRAHATGCAPRRESAKTTRRRSSTWTAPFRWTGVGQAACSSYSTGDRESSVEWSLIVL